MKNIVILISGGGSNMRALVAHVQAAGWVSANKARVAAVLSNDAGAAGLVYAREQGIATAVVSHRDYASRADFDVALRQQIDAYDADVVLLAGFMRILTPEFVAHYEGRLLNIHPSILPNFKGLHTHQAALDAGVKLHGATVHFVTAELDHGAYVMQSCVPVLPSDTADTLAARVLRTEHVIYPQVLDWWVHGQLLWQNGQVRVKNGASQIYVLNEDSLD
ncbi:MAG: phosphoribosylglycinamide formyltransferase [Formosimonas sp.]